MDILKRVSNMKKALDIELYLYFILLVTTGICYVILSYTAGNVLGKDIYIYPTLETGEELIFRGASVDGKWFNANSLLQNIELAVDQYTFSTQDNSVLHVKIPVAKEISLVFNVGPSQGEAEVLSGNEHYQWNFYNDVDIETGWGYAISGSESSILLLKSLLPVVLGAVIFLVLFFSMNVARKKLDRVVLEKIFFIGLIPSVTLLLYFFSLSSTPRISEGKCFWGYDAAVYNFIGRAWGDGILPYIGTFEHKGPFMFLVYMIGNLISWEWGIFIIQCVSLYISILFSYQTGKLLTGSIPKGIIAACAASIYFLGVMDEGALVEEFNLPFLAASTYLVIRYLQNSENTPDHPWRYSFVYGITIGVSLLMRVTNCIAICAFVFCIIVYLVTKRRYKNIAQNIAGGLAGFAVVLIPFFVYFAINGAFYEFIFGTILFNISYASQVVAHSAEELKTIVLYLIPPLACIFLAMEQKRFMRNTIILGSIAASYMMIRSLCYPHYYVILLPFVSICIGFLFQKKALTLKRLNRYSSSYVAIVVALSLTLMGQYLGPNAALGKFEWINSIYDSAYPSQYAQAIKYLSNQIPEDERDRVIGYNVRADWYLISGIYPCFKHAFDHDYRNSLSEELQEETVDFFESLTAKWIVVQQNIGQPEIKEIVEENYVETDSVYIANGNYWMSLYTRNS